MRIVLKRILNKKKISVYNFAKRAGIRYANAFKYMKTDINPKVHTLEKWAAAIGCKVRDLIEEDPPKKA